MPLAPDKQTIVVNKDLGEQPQTLLLVAHEGECLAIDEYDINDLYFTGFRGTGRARTVVVVFPTRDGWTVYSRDYMDLLPRDRLNEHQLEAARYNTRLVSQLAAIKKKTGGEDDDGNHGVYL